MLGITNPVYQSDCIFHEYNGEIIERDDYCVIQTPSNPDFYFGNLILFRSTPKNGDMKRWSQIHQAEFGDTLKHTTFGWDSEDPGDTREFEEDGYRLSKDIGLSLTEYRQCPRINDEIECKKITTDREWAASTGLMVSADDKDFSFGDTRQFRGNQERAYRKMVSDGRGDWWGAFLDEEIAGSMGLFFDTDRYLGRFQNVSTAFSHRRKGICTTLLDTVCRHAFEEVGAKKLMICTDDEDDNPARQVYKNYGFTDGVPSYGLVKSDNKKWNI